MSRKSSASCLSRAFERSSADSTCSRNSSRFGSDVSESKKARLRMRCSASMRALMSWTVTRKTPCSRRRADSSTQMGSSSSDRRRRLTSRIVRSAARPRRTAGDCSGSSSWKRSCSRSAWSCARDIGKRSWEAELLFTIRPSASNTRIPSVACSTSARYCTSLARSSSCFIRSSVMSRIVP